MITVKIENGTALDMLVDRVEFWTDNADVIELYRKMYDNYIEGGCFDGIDFNIMVIVDNDYINYCRIYTEGDDEFEELLAVYKEQGIGDCSCELSFCSFIEAVDNDEEPKIFLVRN
jgi:hypothetical protein